MEEEEEEGGDRLSPAENSQKRNLDGNFFCHVTV